MAEYIKKEKSKLCLEIRMAKKFPEASRVQRTSPTCIVSMSLFLSLVVMFAPLIDLIG